MSHPVQQIADAVHEACCSNPTCVDPNCWFRENCFYAAETILELLNLTEEHSIVSDVRVLLNGPPASAESVLKNYPDLGITLESRLVTPWLPSERANGDV